MTATLQEQREEITRIESLVAELRQRRATDPDAAAKQKISETEARIVAIDRDLAGVQTRLIPPERIPDLLRELVRRNRQLELVSLKTLPATPLIERSAEAPADSPAPVEETDETGEAFAPPLIENIKPVVETTARAQDANIYKHGVEITVSGQYEDFLRYLDKLEALPWQLYWGDLYVDGSDYPAVRMRLLVYTLSLDEAWLKL